MVLDIVLAWFFLENLFKVIGFGLILKPAWPWAGLDSFFSKVNTYLVLNDLSLLSKPVISASNE